MRKLASVVCSLMALTFLSLPVEAKPHDNYNYKYKNKHSNHGQYRRSHRPNNDWSWQRNEFRNRWSRMSASRQRALDAQMRAQWLAYHRGRWNGSYGWNNYSDPGFLDYLHTNNPSLLTTLRSYLGF